MPTPFISLKGHFLETINYPTKYRPLRETLLMGNQGPSIPVIQSKQIMTDRLEVVELSVLFWLSSARSLSFSACVPLPPCSNSPQSCDCSWPFRLASQLMKSQSLITSRWGWMVNLNRECFSSRFHCALLAYIDSLHAPTRWQVFQSSPNRSATANSTWPTIP